LRQILKNDRRHINQRPLSIFFEEENRVLRSDLFHFALERGRNFASGFVGDNRDALVRFETQAIADRVARAGLQGGIDFYGVSAIRHGERSDLREKLRQSNASAEHFVTVLLQHSADFEPQRA
jgi:hypothetical protein